MVPSPVRAIGLSGTNSRLVRADRAVPGVPARAGTGWATPRRANLPVVRLQPERAYGVTLLVLDSVVYEFGLPSS